ncbi:ribonuclease R [Rhodobium gokarnense]|uniref:Ribonuclease R n=1 Tax=Rhodobium gokarnense TaxID=364296 RepID=A0ABT3HA57_9HYPH|nr:ribonuclease R [Rhodobium gokarnense]MCW2307275.1 ribonuclease R [Rhodobium gokarnense]
MPRLKKTAARKTAATLPTRDDVLAFLADNPGAGKRELSRAFRITGSDRIGLKKILKDLAAEGLIAGSRKSLRRPGDLPSVTVVVASGRDADGELIGAPMEWDEDENGPPPSVMILSERGKRPGRAAGVGDRVLVRIAEAPSDAGVGYLGRTIKVLERQPTALLGVYVVGPDGTARIAPVDRKQKEYIVEKADAGDAVDGDLVTVDVLKAGRYGVPRAKVRERIGSMKSEKAVSMIAIHTHAIPHVFPDAVIAEADAAKPVTLQTRGDKREDWRDVPLITIDPADAKDHDDAVYAAPDDDPKNEGGFVVTVAIADVAYYIRPGSALDREALLRGNSVYFPDRVVPMLPERISNDLCSLREGEDRPALAVRMRFDASGRKLDHKFHRVMIRSAAKLSYQEAQGAIDGKPNDKTGPLLEPILKPLWAAYECLKKGRDARAPLDLDLPERKILLNDDDTVERIVVPPRLDAHRLIEECMIQANVSAAETLEKKRAPVIYRIHDASTPEKLEALRDFLSTIGIKLARTGNLRPAVFNSILARVEGTENDELVNEVILRSQAQAEYSPANIGHFGLNLRRYAHFTSPIRRYADLIVHRSLVAALGFGKDGLPSGFEDKLEGISAEISATERRAMAAERDTVDRLIAHWLADHIGAAFNGRIAGVTRSGLFVRLDDSGADGFVPASKLGDDYYRYDEVTHSMTGDRTGETYQLGDRVEVQLAEAMPLAGALRFELLSEGRYQKPSGKGAAKRRAVRNKPTTAKAARGKKRVKRR